jgi:type IV secretory pathway VirB10-like protein
MIRQSANQTMQSSVVASQEVLAAQLAADPTLVKNE